jgi:hypothetical protein
MLSSLNRLACCSGHRSGAASPFSPSPRLRGRDEQSSL